MPVQDKLFVLFQIWSVQPFFYFDLGTVFLFAFMDLKNILKSVLCIIASQRKQSAESRSDIMYGAGVLCSETHSTPAPLSWQDGEEYFRQ